MNNIDKLLYKYEFALKIIQTKFEIMYNELNKTNDYNCIEHIKSRIKSKKSIYNKLINNNYEITEENIENEIHDIAGIRIVCSFFNDIKKVESLIEKDKDITIIKRKDYVTNPKASGYSSLHLLVTIPINLINKIENVEVEIQIRTIAMDMWASLEHKLFYKSTEQITNKTTVLMTKFSKEVRKIDNLMEKMIIESEKYNKVEDNIKYYHKKIAIIEQIPMLKYELAAKQLKEKIEDINYELATTKEVNPIEHIKMRIKEPLNIVKKLEKLNYDITQENMNDHIHDLVGLRIVCSFLSDLKEIAKIIENDPTIKIIKKKNYINNPKPNGYRSYHLNAMIPVKMINKIEYVEVEIQIRTIAMDMWASLEHKICYQKNGNIPNNIKDNLKKISNEMIKIDLILDKYINETKVLNDNTAKKLKLVSKKNI